MAYRTSLTRQTNCYVQGKKAMISIESDRLSEWACAVVDGELDTQQCGISSVSHWSLLVLHAQEHKFLSLGSLSIFAGCTDPMTLVLAISRYSQLAASKGTSVSPPKS